MGEQMTGSDQRVAREKNMEMIFNLLKDQDLSSSDMATKMGLSKTALTKIMKEMLDANYVFYKETNVIQDGRGRRKQYFTLNPDMGMIMFVNFIHQNIEVSLYDMKGSNIAHLLLSTTMHQQEEVLPELMKDMIEMINTYQTIQRPLMNIIIAAPGKVDKKKNVFKQSNMYKALESSEFAQTLHETLNVPVYLKNDINLALHGYIKKTNHVEKNTLMIYLGDSVGGAIYSNGSILEGDHGYAGEFGLMKTFDEHGNLTTVESLCAMKSLYHHLEIDGVEALIDLDRKDSPVLEQSLLSLSSHMAQLIHNFYQIFDFAHVCIAGDIAHIKKRFSSKVQDQLKRYDLENLEINLDFEEHIEALMMLGAKDLGQTESFQSLISKRKGGLKHEHI
jgi:predicted NBD/HSP70 family sugar kinase